MKRTCMGTEGIRIYIALLTSVFPLFKKIVYIPICFAFSIFKNSGFGVFSSCSSAYKAQAPEKKIAVNKTLKRKVDYMRLFLMRKRAEVPENII
jgi:hypothetical protein